MKACVIGLGYIGLPTAALAASRGVEIHGVDISENVVKTINSGRIHIVEPDLDGLVRNVVDKGFLKADIKPCEADVFVIAVPTPFKRQSIDDSRQTIDRKEQSIDDRQQTTDEKQTADDRRQSTVEQRPSTIDQRLSTIDYRPTSDLSIPTPDISYVESAIKSIIPYLRDGNLIIIESTSPVGTTEKMYKLVKQSIDYRRQTIDRKEQSIDKKQSIDDGRQTTDKGRLSTVDQRPLTIDQRPTTNDSFNIHIAYCPERVLPGRVIYELENNDRVIGGIDQASTEKACDFYSKFVRAELHKTNARTAEMCKLTENAYRDVNIAFANELSMICDKAEINVYDLIKLTNKHPRVNILTPGCGVGGHCIAVDPWFIVSDYPEQANLMHQARLTNDYKPEFVIEKIKQSIVDSRQTMDKGQSIDDGRQTIDSKKQSIVDSRQTMDKKQSIDNGRQTIDRKKQSTVDQRPTTNHYRPIVAILGLAFKPDIDDLRESPALYIAENLIKQGFNILPVEPNIKSHTDFTIYGLDYALEKADIIVILVGHREFKNLKISKKCLNFTGLKINA